MTRTSRTHSSSYSMRVLHTCSPTPANGRPRSQRSKRARSSSNGSPDWCRSGSTPSTGPSQAGLESADLNEMADHELDQFLDSLDSPASLGSEAFENFLGGLLKKAKVLYQEQDPASREVREEPDQGCPRRRSQRG